MPRYLIIDGYNAISKTRELDARKDISLEAARMSFITMLKDFMARKGLFDKVFIVFDSKEENLEVRRHSYGKVEVLFGTNNKNADSVIVDMLRDASPADKISVSSDDNFVRNHARVFGGSVISIDELKKIIMLKERDFRGRIKEKDLEPDKIKDINQELKKYWGLR
ncbi:NYN domain-containing protein [Candidatus Omnitrophota bacterium]